MVNPWHNWSGVAVGGGGGGLSRPNTILGEGHIEVRLTYYRKLHPHEPRCSE